MFPTPAAVRWSSRARLDRRSPPSQGAPELGAPYSRARAAPGQTLSEVELELPLLEQRPRAEATHVPVRDVRAVVESDNCPPVGVVLEGSVPVEPEAPCHAQVNEEVTATQELDDDILASTTDADHAVTCQSGGDGIRGVRRRQAWIEDADALELPALEGGDERAANRLDLGSPGTNESLAPHSPSPGRRPRATDLPAHGGPGPSKRTGRTGGARPAQGAPAAQPASHDDRSARAPTDASATR